MQHAAPRTVADSYAPVETQLLKGPWVMADDYTICDPYLFTLSQWLEDDGVDPRLFPRIIDHRRRMSERPAVRKAIAEELDR